MANPQKFIRRDAWKKIRANRQRASSVHDREEQEREWLRLLLSGAQKEKTCLSI